MKQAYNICPSILSANFAHLGNEVRAVLNAGADRIHIDVMDNHYVPNLTFGPMVVKALRQDGITAPMDVHLMVEPVDVLIEQFAQAGSDCIVFHPEASKHIDRSLHLAKSFGCEAGLAINPATPLSCLDHTLELCDRILLMSVNPGFGGQQFIPYTLDKIRAVRQRIDQLNKPIRLEIDGGVTIDNIAEIAAAGADTFVAGSAIFGQDNYQQVIAAMKQQLT